MVQDNNQISFGGRICMILLFVSIAIFIAIIFIMPKRLTMIEYYATSLSSIILQLLTDLYLEFKYHLYGYFSSQIDWISLLIFFFIYPPVNIIFLNFYPYKSKILKKSLFLSFWVIFSVSYEWVAVKTEFFYYSGWKLWYSAIIYPVLFIILLLNLKLVRLITKFNYD
ncbi:CBO0543 family protein [Niallia sp. NCCP-28]|uniref:CBO0543 family protein n=1 Tax=Niallia sp. NCCP-28 TaxID=2934712 RepID=UPI0035CFFDB3